MADQFKFDKKTIVGEGFTFRSWYFSFRELILGLVLGVLLITCLFLAGFLGKSSTDLKQAQASAQAAQNACKGSTCLRTSAHIMELLNTSVNPCDDFYSFACGSYRANNPVDEYTLYQTIRKQMYQENMNQLIAILNSPSKRYVHWSSEKKLKDYFWSCKDDFSKEQLKGKPLFKYIFPPLGGWYVKDGASWSSSSWDLNKYLKVVQADMWVDAFFAPRVYPDDWGSKNRIIWIFPGGSGRYMRWRDYTDNPSAKQKKVQDGYKNFMRTVAQLVARDAGLSTSSDQGLTNRIDVFVDDAYDVEARMAKFASKAEYQQDPHIEANRVSLTDLNQKTGPEINWITQMSYLFDGAGVTGNTKVVLPYPSYLTSLTAMIRGLDSASRNRKLHNYLIWRVLEMYSYELSSDYTHANRQFVVNKWGYLRFWSSAKRCLWITKWFFDTALGALYIKARFNPKNKDKVTEITEAVRTAMETSITNNKWMDKATKDYAIYRVKSATYKIGYPDFFTDDNKVDSEYHLLTINRTDYFGNMVAITKEHKRLWTQLLREGEDRTRWRYPIYYPYLAISWWRDEIAVPAGFLRFPVYEFDMPHYYSFGSMGAVLGHRVHHLVDERGRRWDKGGAYLKSDAGWWSSQTLQNYNTVRKCVADLYSKATQGPYISNNGDQKIVSVNGSRYAGEAMAITQGIRLSYNAYQAWQQKYGQDSTSPGLPYNPQQLFFISFAQLHCYNLHSKYQYLLAAYGWVHYENRVNLAFKELPEFRQAFQCKATDKMVSPKPCTYY